MTKKYEVTISGRTPLLMHWDNIAWADEMDAWKSDAGNKKSGKAGDDRSPAFRWLGYTYHDDTHVVLPSDNLMKAIMQGGAMVPVPGAKGNKTFKAQTQSGMMIPGNAGWPLIVNDNNIPIAKLFALKSATNFAEHAQRVKDFGFELLVKRATVGASKHVRVRPMFRNWSATGEILVWDEALTLDALRTILEYAGQYKGLGDWRPGGKTPGPWGTFAASVKETT